MIDKDIMFRIFAEREDKFNVDAIPRYCEKDAVKYLAYKEVLAITGVRRSGKTYLLYLLMKHLIKTGTPKENILYINFEDERLAFIEPKDLEKICEFFLEFSNAKGKLFFFLDEIQNVPFWEKWLSRMHEKIKFVVTGSNSILLSSEIATALTGRSIELSLYPFSFKEFILNSDCSLLTKSKYLAESSAKISKYLKEYLERGGFPEPLLYKKTELLQEYYKTILLRDIISRYNIKHKDYIEKISLYLLSNLGKPISLYALEKESPLGINTIKNYLSYFEKCFLLFFVRKFDYSLKKQNVNPKKIYAVDAALAEHVSFRFTEDKGRIIENIVFIELKRNKNEVYYHKNKNECDFILKKGLKIVQVIQVCYKLTDDNRKRELAGLAEAMNDHKLKKGTLITFEQEDNIKIKNAEIRIIPLWKWLLE